MFLVWRKRMGAMMSDGDVFNAVTARLRMSATFLGSLADDLTFSVDAVSATINDADALTAVKRPKLTEADQNADDNSATTTAALVGNDSECSVTAQPPQQRGGKKAAVSAAPSKLTRQSGEPFGVVREHLFRHWSRITALARARVRT